MNNIAAAILSYNHPDHTANCLQSALNFFETKDIFLIHNGSLSQHIQTLKNQFPDIHHIELPTNKGFTGGANALLKFAFKSHPTVLFLTNDTELTAVDFSFKNNLKDPALFFSSIKLMKRNSNEVDSVMGGLDASYGQLSHQKSNTVQNNKLIPYIPGTAFWISKKYFELLDGFDESFHTYWEDVDFSLRAQKLGLELNRDANTIAKHKIGKTCHKDRFYTYHLYQRNRGRFMRKHQMTSFKFYTHYIYDLLKHSKKDYAKAYSIFKDHKVKNG